MKNRSDTFFANCHFFIVLDGKKYSFVIDTLFGCTSHIEGINSPNSELLSFAEEEVTKAFQVYGRFGNGVLNEFGKPEFKVDPEFKGKA